MDIAGKVVVITGASRGLGAGMAARLAEGGARLGLCARTVLPAQGDAVVQSVDITDAAAVVAFTDDVAEALGPIDLWVNNAGVLDPVAPLRDADPDAVATNVAINVAGVSNGTIAYVRHRREVGGGGALVNITSGAARSPYQGWAAYCASKAAVDMLTRVVAAEESSSGTRVLAVAPGVVDTDMQARIRASSPEDFPEVGRFHELHRTGSFNSPAWVADQLVELAFGPAPDDVVVRIADEPRG
ncbi:MAG: SDR family NAD(P)-dependent oxidoreductase [Acidimicrobiales bacterium]